MTMQRSPRYRADLIEFAIAPEIIPGVAPTSPSWRQVGLITGGVQLPDPTFEWEPFFGVGVSNRNMLFPIQGRHQFQGSIPSIYLTHAESRYLLELAMGVAFRSSALAAGTEPTTADITANAVDEDSFTGTTTIDSGHTSTSVAKSIVVPDELEGGIYNDTWAYVGTVTSNVVTVYRTRDVATATGQTGWNGKVPVGATSFKLYSVQNADIAYGTSGARTIGIRQSIVQPTFMVGTRWTTDTGKSFIRNYTGCKINRLSITMEEGRPVTMSVDFMGTGMRHNLGGATTPVPRFGAVGTDADTSTVKQTRRIGWSPINTQPYFFSTVDLRFLGTSFARMSSFTLDIDNQLDPKFYIHRDTASQPSEVDARQSPVEILEGRRNITLRGQVDADSSTNNDAQFLQHLLQQGRRRHASDNPLVGISVEAEMKVLNVEGGSVGNSLTISLPGSLQQNNREDATDFQEDSNFRTDTGLILRSAPHNIPAPPGVNVPIDFEGMASSVRFEIKDRSN